MGTVQPLRCMGTLLCVGMQVEDVETSTFVFI